MRDEVQVNQNLTLLESLEVLFFLMSRMKIIRGIFLIVVSLSILSEILNIDKTKDGFELVMGFVSAPLFFIAFFAGLPSIAVILIYKLKPNIFKGISYKFNYLGLETSTISTNRTILWDEFNGYRETKKFIYLFLDKNCHVIQKRLLRDSAELNWIRSILDEKLS